jgi:hypothetical protein
MVITTLEHVKNVTPPVELVPDQVLLIVLLVMSQDISHKDLVLNSVLKDNTKPLTLLVELKTTVEFAEFVTLIVKLVTTLVNKTVNTVLKVSSPNQEPTNTVKLLAHQDTSLMLTLECVSLVNTHVPNVPLQELTVTVSVVSKTTVS